MNRSPARSIRLKPVLVLIGLLLLGGVLFLYRSSPGTVRERMVILRSGGGSLGGRDRVLVRGDEISYGDSVEVLNRPLVVSLTDSSVVLSFEPGSRWRYGGLSTGSQGPKLVVRKGEGRVRVRDRPVRLALPSRSLHVESGSLEWKVKGRKLEVRTGPRTAGYLVVDGSTVPLTERVSSGGAFAPPASGPEVPALPRTYSGPPAQSSSLISGDRLRRRLNRIRGRTGEYPRTLRGVFGHWLRDRWGNVYYYDPSPNGFVLISGGPDERLFTDDDRRWTE